MFDNKFFINLYILVLDKNFEIFIPVDEKVGNIIKLIENSLDGITLKNNSNVLMSLLDGTMYNNNDIIRNTNIRNGTRLILI